MSLPRTGHWRIPEIMRRGCLKEAATVGGLHHRYKRRDHVVAGGGDPWGEHSDNAADETRVLLCSFLFVTPVRASRAAKYQGSAAQRLLTAPESVSRFRVRLSSNAVLHASVQRSAI